MTANRAKNSKPELALRKALWHAGFRGYRLHYKKAPGRPDIAYPSRKIAISSTAATDTAARPYPNNIPKLR